MLQFIATTVVHMCAGVYETPSTSLEIFYLWGSQTGRLHKMAVRKKVKGSSYYAFQRYYVEISQLLLALIVENTPDNIHSSIPGSLKRDFFWFSR